MRQLQLRRLFIKAVSSFFQTIFAVITGLGIGVALGHLMIGRQRRVLFDEQLGRWERIGFLIPLASLPLLLGVAGWYIYRVLQIPNLTRLVGPLIWVFVVLIIMMVIATVSLVLVLRHGVRTRYRRILCVRLKHVEIRAAVAAALQELAPEFTEEQKLLSTRFKVNGGGIVVSKLPRNLVTRILFKLGDRERLLELRQRVLLKIRNTCTPFTENAGTFIRFSMRTMLAGSLFIGSLMALYFHWEAWYIESEFKADEKYCGEARFSPDGRRIVTINPNDQKVRCFDAQSLKEQWNKTGYDRFALSPDNQHIALVVNTSIDICYVASGVRKKAFYTRGTEPIIGLACSADGTSLAAATAIKLFTFQLITEKSSSSLETSRAFTYVPDGNILIALDYLGGVGRMSQNGRLIGSGPVVRGAKLNLSSLERSTDGKLLLGAAKDGTIHIWRYPKGDPQLKFKLPSFGGNVPSAEFSPDSSLILACNGNVTLIDAATGKALATLRHAESAHFSPDGSHIITAAKDGMVQIWNRRYPEGALGILQSPEPWLALAALLFFAYSAFRDRRDFVDVGRRLVPHSKESKF